MESAQYSMKRNAHDYSNPIMKLLFLWTIKLFRVGSRDDLKIEDLFGPKRRDKSTSLGREVERHWNNQVTKCQRKVNDDRDPKKLPKPSLLKALFFTFKWEFLTLAMLGFFNEVISRLSQPILLGVLLSYFRAVPQITTEHALYAAGGLVLINLVTVISMNHYMFAAYQLGMRARISVCSLIYRKSLKLSATALGNSAPGKVVNLLSNDVNRFDLAAFFVHFLWLAPVAALVTLLLLFREVGLAGVLGVAVVFTVMPLQSYTGKLSARFRLQTAIRTDERARLMNEIISGVQVIKMYTWELPFTKLVQMARKLELRVVRKNSYVRALFMSFMLFTTRAAIFCTMASLVLQGIPLTSTKVFVFAQFFSSLSMTMSAMFVRSISETAEAWVSIHRLQDYLNQDEFQGHRPLLNGDNTLVDSDNPKKEETLTENGNIAIPIEAKKPKVSIKITKGNAKWLQSDEGLTLEDININILKGKLVGIIGPVGSGKTSLLQAILGELSLDSGTVEVNGKLSYASQEPWVFGSTVRQNILFGLPYDEFRYNEVVRVCSLQKDFQQFSNGDQTLVGDKGTSLSGGQKARINLARAVYRDSSIYLLDDPLSAVDAHVGRQLYDKCIRTHLRKCTRLLVTHQLHHLTNADHIIIMRNGKIEMQGSYHTIATSSFEYARLLIPSETEKQVEVERPDFEREVSRDRSVRQRRTQRSRLNSVSSVASIRSMSMASSYADLGDLNLEEPDKFVEEKPSITNAEVSSKGVVKGSVGMHYVKAATNWFGIVLAIILFVGTQALASFFDYFVAFWTSQEERRYHNSLNSTALYNSTTSMDFVRNSTESPTHNASIAPDLSDGVTEEDDGLLPSNTLITVAGVTVLVILISGLLRAFHFYNACIKASQTLHDLMFRGIIRSPMKFFDLTPVGRIMNRFSKDMGAVDELLPKAFLDAAQQLLVMAGAVAVASTVNPMFLAVVAVLAVFFYFLRKAYLKCSKNIKRFEGITRSPVFTHLGATLSGLPTIRACHAQHIIQDEFDKLQDVHTSSFFMYIATMGGFGFSLDFLCLLFVTAVTFSFFVMGADVLGDKVGLAITQAISLTFLMQYGVRQSAEVSNQLMAVERLVEYTQLPPEKGIKPDDVDAREARKNNTKLPTYRTPPRDWPEQGKIEFQDLSLRYGPTDDTYVLKQLNFTVQPREKIGIVGRTGAGKSSLIQAMFRIAYLDGDIVIDGVKTGEITLEDLRKQLSIIPQDPMLFNGTLRRNLDPFEEFSDDALWQVLSEVELKESLNNPAGLAMHVMDGGANLSVGQRQLICLARALLRNNRLLMMDEATANVDPHTDNLIQQTIRTKFTNCTVLTIAHRLNTIMDSDKVLVMELGSVVEYDHPHLLLQKKGVTPEEDGYFRKMVLETGQDTFAKLEKVAKECYLKKQKQV